MSGETAPICAGEGLRLPPNVLGHAGRSGPWPGRSRPGPGSVSGCFEFDGSIIMCLIWTGIKSSLTVLFDKKL